MPLLVGFGFWSWWRDGLVCNKVDMAVAPPLFHDTLRPPNFDARLPTRKRNQRAKSAGDLG